MTRWNWVEPSFFAFLCSLLFMAGKRRGRFWFLVVVVEKTNTIVPTTARTRTKGVIVYMYCIVCTIIHIHLPF